MTNPSTLNLLSGNAFDFTIDLFPEVEFFVDKVVLPGISVEPVKFPTPFAPMYNPGDSPAFDTLSVNFKVNENLKNWLSIFKWLSDTSTASNYATYDKDKIFSSVNLTVMTNKRVPMVEFKFVTAFPVSLSPIDLTALESDVTYRDATAVFKFQRMEFTRLV